MNSRHFPPSRDGADALDHCIKNDRHWFFTVEMVADALQCSVDHVRRIPRGALPYSRVGKRNIYRFEDIDSYVRSMRVPDSRQANGSAIVPGLIESLADSVRGRPSKGRRHV